MHRINEIISHPMGFFRCAPHSFIYSSSIDREIRFESDCSRAPSVCVCFVCMYMPLNDICNMDDRQFNKTPTEFEWYKQNVYNAGNLMFFVRCLQCPVLGKININIIATNKIIKHRFFCCCFCQSIHLALNISRISEARQRTSYDVVVFSEVVLRAAECITPNTHILGH